MKKFYSYEKHISNINIIEKSHRNIFNKSKEKKVSYISPRNKNEKFLFNIKIDLTKLLNDNSFCKEKGKKSFRFSKSSRKIS